MVKHGIDIIEIETLKALFEKNGKRVIKRVFTDEEIAYCENKVNKFQHYAARFAAKEAVMKALGTGWNQGVHWKQIEIKNNYLGLPQVTLCKKAKDLFELNKFSTIAISITHSRNYAIASVIFS